MTKLLKTGTRQFRWHIHSCLPYHIKSCTKSIWKARAARRWRSMYHIDKSFHFIIIYLDWCGVVVYVQDYLTLTAHKPTGRGLPLARLWSRSNICVPVNLRLNVTLVSANSSSNKRTSVRLSSIGGKLKFRRRVATIELFPGVKVKDWRLLGPERQMGKMIPENLQDLRVYDLKCRFSKILDQQGQKLQVPFGNYSLQFNFTHYLV